MSDISDAITSLRYIIEDSSTTRQPGDIFEYTSSNIFTLSEINVISISSVYINGALIADSEYSFDSATNKITINASLSAGDSIEVIYTYYPDYSDTELESYIRSAVKYLSVNNYFTFIVDSSDTFYPEMSDREKDLVAMIASILVKPDNISYRLPDISFNVPKSKPTRDIIQQVISTFKKNTHGIFNVA